MLKTPSSWHFASRVISRSLVDCPSHSFGRLLKFYQTQTGIKQKGIHKNPPQVLPSPPRHEPYRDLLKSKPAIELDMMIRENRLKNRFHPIYAEKRNKMTQPLDPLKYKLQDLPQDHDLLVPFGNTAHLPFSVQRTKSQNLPIYRDYREARKVKLTIVRKITGDFEELMTELKKITSNAEMEAKVGQIVIKGLHKRVITDYLMRLGF